MPHVSGNGRTFGMTGPDGEDYEVYTRELPWTPYRPDEVRPLGRHVLHDSRSLDYRHVASGRELVAVEHARHIPILDQGDVGSCTGNAATGGLATEPVELADVVAKVLAELNEAYALGIYSDAETIDGDGPYPPNDNGSSGLSVAKVLKARGLISGYRHATSLEDALDALQGGPVLWGTSWVAGFDSIDANGQIHWTGASRGGHELVLRGDDPTTELVDGDNSWGTTWGPLGGRFKISHADLAKSLADDGDITILVPFVAPAPPNPEPVPTLLRFVQTWWSAVEHWAVDERHVEDNKRAATAARALAVAAGLYVEPHAPEHLDEA